MDTITINAEEWEEISRKIEQIAGFIEQYAERLPADNEAWLNETQVCDYLKISKKTLQRLRNSGNIKFSTIAKNTITRWAKLRICWKGNRSRVAGSSWKN